MVNLDEESLSSAIKALEGISWPIVIYCVLDDVSHIAGSGDKNVPKGTSE